MNTVETDAEYGVEVPGKGYVTGSTPIHFKLTDEPYTGTTFVDDAVALLRRTRQTYIDLGCPEIADTVRLISRTVTVTRGDWTPHTSPAIVEADSSTATTIRKDNSQ